MEARLGPADATPRAFAVAWELLEFTREMLSSLEDAATRVAAAQIAGMIALWTQLYTYEEVVPKAFGWAAWLLIVLGVSVLGPLVTPRRLARFWSGLPLHSLLAYDEPTKERELINEICAAMQAQINRLHRGMVFSIALGLTGLFLAVVGYVVDKGLYGD